MKIIIIGDSHGHTQNIKHVMGFAQNIKAGAVVHVGDWDDPKSVETVLEYKIPLYSVLGNADIDHEIENLLFFNCKKFDPDFLEIKIDGKKIGIVHKEKSLSQTCPSGRRVSSLDVLFVGHYHSQESKMLELTKIIRPGALVNGINFAVYETVTGEVEFLNE